MKELTLEKLIDLTRTHAGEAEEGALDGDVIDVLFTNLGYDSVALLEVVGQIKHQYGIDLSDETVGEMRTPRQVLDKVNEVIGARSPSHPVKERQHVTDNASTDTRTDKTTDAVVPDEGHFLPNDLYGLQLVLLASGGRLFQIVHALGELKIADHLDDGPLPIDELARRAGAHELSLQRVLRCSAMLGIFAEGPTGVFRTTPVAKALTSDNPHGVLPLLRYNHMELTARPFDEILHSVRTGEPAFPKTFGVSFNEYLENNPEADRFCDDFQSYWARQFAEEELDQWDLGRFGSIADLGGGDGYFLAQALRRYPAMTAWLLDLPWMAKKAEGVLAEHQVADRAQIIGGDLLTDPVPEGAEAYFVKAVFMRFSDQQAEHALRNIRTAIGDTGARLLIVDSVLKPGNAWDHGKLLDVDMLVLHGGRKRTLDDWHGLFSRTGFRLRNEPVYHWDLLECEPV
ncbi:methyltransferase (plasmid) [Streptomyces sp. CG1]|uniref:methyltransferase n=1 Tax=Streptomyces sp. CG1 TaxID=1287523 RepID=UPI0034E2FEE2